jgi:hypothetical protein
MPALFEVGLTIIGIGILVAIFEYLPIAKDLPSEIKLFVLVIFSAALLLSPMLYVTFRNIIHTL